MPKGDTDKSQPSTSGHKRAADDGGEEPPPNAVSPKKKVFNDSVHGHIELHPLLVDIIDTPEFQRLRFIKQLGMCYFVYPGASHNRFEHSIGVCHLAGELARNLHSNQKQLGITPQDILCVEIAGLCHDLGHGPFSHVFDDLFLKKVLKDKAVKHEKLSVKMFDHMLQKNALREKFEQFNLKYDVHIPFIKELIEGVEVGQEVRSNIGRKKRFLYDIVANKRNGIDVDKWDYLARDSLYLGMSNPFDWRRYIKFARVPKGEEQICVRDKEISDLYDMFHTRFSLHRRAYQHKVTQSLEAMIVEALEKANGYLKIPGEKIKGEESEEEESEEEENEEEESEEEESEVENREMRTMSQSIQDMEAYSKLTDNVMWQILSSSKKKMKKSRNLIKRILKRDIYVCIGQKQLEVSTKSPTTQQNIEEADVPRQIHDEFMKLSPPEGPSLKKSDIIVRTANFSYGMGEKDPVKKVKFYKKDEPDEAVDIDEIIQNSMALPQRFSEKILRVFVKKTGPEMKKTHQLLMQAFDEWCKPKEKSPETSE